VWKGFLHREEHALEHDVAQFIEQRFRQHVHGCEFGDARVCDKHVDLSEFLHCFGEEAFEIGEHSASDARRLVERLAAAPKDDHLRAVGLEFPCGGDWVRESHSSGRDRDLMSTIRTFADCSLNVKETARRLRVHTNTVYFRLNKIKERTGVDPRTFTGTSLLITALKLLDNQAVSNGSV